jgi:hypothetical protein
MRPGVVTLLLDTMPRWSAHRYSRVNTLRFIGLGNLLGVKYLTELIGLPLHRAAVPTRSCRPMLHSLPWAHLG